MIITVNECFWLYDRIQIYLTHRKDTTILILILCHHHHHQAMQIAWIHLTLSCHLSLLAITADSCSTLHPIFTQTYIFIGVSLGWRQQMNITFESFLTSSALPSIYCLSYLNACEMGGKWSYNCSFMVCYFQVLFKTACIILVYL